MVRSVNSLRLCDERYALHQRSHHHAAARVVTDGERWSKKAQGAEDSEGRIYLTVGLARILSGDRYVHRSGAILDQSREHPHHCHHAHSGDSVPDVAGQTNHGKRCRQWSLSDYLCRYRRGSAEEHRHNLRYVKAGTISYFLFAFGVIALAIVVLEYSHRTGFRRVPITPAKRRRQARGRRHSSHIPFRSIRRALSRCLRLVGAYVLITVAQFSRHSVGRTAYLEWGKPLRTARPDDYLLHLLLSVGDSRNSGYGRQSQEIRRIRAGASSRTGDGEIILTLCTPRASRLRGILPRIHRGAAKHNGGGIATNIQGVYFGGTLIVVGVTLQTVKRIESMVVMRHYRGFARIT